MSPERFLMRPRLWLQMISDYGACSSPALNFAYDLCVDKVDHAQMAGLDLSGWRNVLNGSEPVVPQPWSVSPPRSPVAGFSESPFFRVMGWPKLRCL